jgi:hypothetical protein
VKFEYYLKYDDGDEKLKKDGKKTTKLQKKDNC